jgi:hypothetical protein
MTVLVNAALTLRTWYRRLRTVGWRQYLGRQHLCTARNRIDEAEMTTPLYAEL